MVLKGMSPNQYTIFLGYVHQKHRFGFGFKSRLENKNNSHLNIKYIESSYDSRTNEIWKVDFTCSLGMFSIRTNHFVSYEDGIPDNFEYNSISEILIAFVLNEANEEFYNHFKVK